MNLEAADVWSLYLQHRKKIDDEKKAKEKEEEMEKDIQKEIQKEIEKLSDMTI